jgi:hypothetical protein
VNESTVGIAVFGVLSAAVAVVCHRRLSSFALAVFVSGPVAALLFQVIAAVYIGYVDPFFLIALITSTLLAWVVSCVVGIALRIGGRRMTDHSDRPTDSR